MNTVLVTSRCVAGRRDVSAGRARLVDQRPAPAERADAVQCVRQPRRQQEVLQLQDGQCLCVIQVVYSLGRAVGAVLTTTASVQV